MRPIRTLIALASEKELRLLQNLGVGKGAQEVARHSIDEIADRLLAWADEPAREQAAPGMARHAVPPTVTEREYNRDLFAAHVAELIGRAFAAGTPDGHPYHRIVIAAAPAMLGALRDKLDDAVKDKVYAELDKDLIHVEAAKLPRHFEEVMVL